MLAIAPFNTSPLQTHIFIELPEDFFPALSCCLTALVTAGFNTRADTSTAGFLWRNLFGPKKDSYLVVWNTKNMFFR